MLLVKQLVNLPALSLSKYGKAVPSSSTNSNTLAKNFLIQGGQSETSSKENKESQLIDKLRQNFQLYYTVPNAVLV